MTRKRSLSQQVSEMIYALILREKEYRPGDQLPSANELSARFGVRRATLREAIRDHDMIMDFLRRRDADGARQAMSIHIRHSIHHLNLKTRYIDAQQREGIQLC